MVKLMNWNFFKSNKYNLFCDLLTFLRVVVREIRFYKYQFDHELYTLKVFFIILVNSSTPVLTSFEI